MLEDADIERIVNAVKTGAPIPGGPEVEADVHKDLALIEEAVKPFFALVAEALEELNQRLKEVEEEFGGFTSGMSGIIEKRRKGEFVGKLKESYPDIGRFEGIVKELADVDVWEAMGDDLYDLRDADDFETKAKEYVGNMEGRFGKYLPKLEAKAEPAGEKPVTAVEVEIEKTDVDPKLRKYLKSSKAGG